MKNLLGLALIVGVAFAADPFNTGKFALVKASGVSFGADTVISAETTWTKAYQIASVRGMTGYVALHIEADSLKNDSLCIELLLQESFDGSYWRWTTRLGALHADRTGAEFDSIYEVNLYPTPFVRFGVLNYASSNDTFLVRKLDAFNPAY